VPARREEELRLLRSYHSSGDPRAREAAVERFLPLARSLARRYSGGGEPLEDLEQVACLALVRAVDGFDPTRGTAFTSYAVPSIAGAIKRHFRDNGWSVRVPRDLQELALRVESVNDELVAETGHRATAAHLELGRAHDRAALHSVLETLDERDRVIIALYYKEELTQAEIGRKLGYSQMHVSRLLRQAVERLRLEAAQQEDQVTDLVSSAAA